MHYKNATELGGMACHSIDYCSYYSVTNDSVLFYKCASVMQLANIQV